MITIFEIRGRHSGPSFGVDSQEQLNVRQVCGRRL